MKVNQHKVRKLTEKAASDMSDLIHLGEIFIQELKYFQANNENLIESLDNISDDPIALALMKRADKLSADMADI